MNNYRAYGQKITNYYADIQADDSIEAWNKADHLLESEWIQTDDLDEISPSDLEQITE